MTIIYGLVECNTDARFVVDGHREKTLSLLWKIIFHFQVSLIHAFEFLSTFHDNDAL